MNKEPLATASTDAENWWLAIGGPSKSFPDKFLCVMPDQHEGTVRQDMICRISALDTLNDDDLRHAALIVNAPALLKAAKIVLHLHMCEQEGIEAGMPGPDEWFEAVEVLGNVVELAEKPIELKVLTDRAKEPFTDLWFDDKVGFIWEAIETRPCRQVDGLVEQCAPDESAFYSVYLREAVTGQAFCVADLATESQAITLAGLIQSSAEAYCPADQNQPPQQ